jgi:hypothetical protein
MALSIPLLNETTAEDMRAHMCPSVSVLTGKSTKRNTFMGISSTDDIGDGRLVCRQLLSVFIQKKKIQVRLVRF